MICLKVPEVGARFAGGACAAAAVESASTIATNIASLVFIVLPRSGHPRRRAVARCVDNASASRTRGIPGDDVWLHDHECRSPTCGSQIFGPVQKMGGNRPSPGARGVVALHR